MKYFYLCFFACFFYASNVLSSGICSDTTKLDPWLGIWSGDLEIYNANGLSQSVPMKLKHFLTDTAGVYGWYIIYGEEETGTRAYYLKAIDEEKGHYRLDEKNSILIDTYTFGNKMVSNFEVQGNLISTIYTLKTKDEMIFEIIFGKTNDPLITGNQEFNGEEIPEVFSYQVGGFQKAILNKEK